VGSEQYPQRPNQPRRRPGKVDASLNDKLNGVEWGEFRLGDLFSIHNTLSFNKDRLTDGNQYDYVTRTSQNQGILQTTGFVNKDNLNEAGNWSLGLLQMDFFYRERPWYAGQFVRKINSKTKQTKASILFFSVILNQQKQQLLSGLVRDVDAKFTNAIVSLPTRNGAIDYDFMESFVSELEAARLAELEAYLQATGLSDTTLTDEESEMLATFENNEFVWGEFKIEEILEWQSQKEIDPLKLEQLKDETEAIYPFYGQATINNGIISYNQLTSAVLNNKDAKPTILIHSNNQNIVYLETPFYLKDGHGATSVLQSKKLNKINQMCIIASIDKVIKNKYSYNNKATKIELKNTVIELPTKNQTPDYDRMNTFIAAIQKLVIRDVVQYADRKIAATAQAMKH
jgi:hypothetical protein